MRFSAHSTRWQEPVTSRSAPWKESFTAISSRAQIERLAAGAVPIEDAVPDLAGAFREPEQLAVFGVDGALVDQKIEVDGAAPIAFADQHHRQRLDLSRLYQGQHLEQFVEGAVTAREGHQRPRAQQEVQLAQREIAETKAQLRGDVGIGILLVRQTDVEPDRLRADVEGATVGGFHHPRA